MRVSDITRRLEKKFPKSNAESWDNVGLLVGEAKQEVKKIQISLDATEDVIERAVKNGVDMIITHHPLIFSPVKTINDGSLIGRKLLKLIKNDIALYSMHTNLDSSKEGLNEYVADLLGWDNSSVIDEEYYDMYRLSVYVPNEWYPGVIKKIEEAGLELNGYQGVSYTADTSERYTEKESGTLHLNENKRVEVIGEKGRLYGILNTIKKIHPYEEVAYEVVKIENKYFKSGIGRYTLLEKPVTIEDIAEEVKVKLGIENLRLVARDKKAPVRRVAVVNGSGMSYFKKLKRLKVDLFLTGDVKYHEGLDALEDGLNVIDIGHYESEHFFHRLITKELKEKDGLEIEVYNDIPVFKYI